MKKIAICVLATLVLTACGVGTPTEQEKKAAEELIDAAYRAKNYGRLLMLADSLQGAGTLAEAEAYYWQGYACDRMMQHRTAEFYWNSAIDKAGKSKEPADLNIYAKAGSYLTNLLSVRGDYEEALKVAQPIAERLESLQCDTTSDYTNLLIFIGCCQSRFGLSDEAANESYNRAYKMHLANIEKSHTSEAYKNAIAGIINIAYNCIGISHYKEALTWTERYGKLLSQYEMRNDAQPEYVDKQWARYNLYRAQAFEGLGKKEEAAQSFLDYQRTSFSQTPESQIDAADFLITAERWSDAADNFKCLDKLFSQRQTGFSLENIQELVLKKYRVNMLADRLDTASAVARQVCDSLHNAIAQSRRLDAQELETVHQKEAQIIEEQTAATRLRMIVSLIILAIILTCFIVYTLYRRKAMHRLKAAHEQLKNDTMFLEEDTSAKERLESEQRIARDIQAKMLPTGIIRRKDIDLRATLMPAKDVGGDLYDFFIRDEKLFFCIGDAHDKGVSASLAMAVIRFKFRMVSFQKNLPNQIVDTINKQLIEDGDSPTSFTLFVGMLDLQTGRLYYCNAGHRAPVLIGSGIGLLPVDNNITVGQRADWTFSVQETLIDPGSVIFVYTDGLTEAENKEHAPFEERRMMGEALQFIHGLNPTPEAIIKRMTEAVHRHTGDAEQTDDITMLAIRYLKHPAGILYQRSMSLPNDIKEMPQLTHFGEEVCKAMRFDQQTTSGICLTLEEAIADIMDYAYPEGAKGDIHIETYASDTQLKFVVRDYGVPFDPTATIAHQNMDSIHYERISLSAGPVTDGQKEQNVLTLIKNIKNKN